MKTATRWTSTEGTAWCAVSYNGQSGYVMTSFLRFDSALDSPAPTATPAPAPAVSGGKVKIENIRARIGSEAEELEIPVLAVDASGKYVTIYVINTYNGKPAFEYTVPGANDTITISFTVSGL